MSNSPLSELLEMLTFMRPAGSKTERRFIRRFLTPLGVIQDKAGNCIIRVGSGSSVLWSCHTDTVHKSGGTQLVEVSDGWAALPKGSKSNCLGADDTVGVWLMWEMIRAKVPGLYVFHRGEECGGIGSGFIANNTPALLSGIEAAIALDRMGTKSVITHQCWRTCSDVFAESLADALGMGHEKDDGGTFTDTAQYTDLVGECTNLSVGYYAQHTAKECVDLEYVLKLRDALCKFDESRLVYSRRPGQASEYASASRFEPEASAYSRYRSVYDVVRAYPSEMADLLHELGFDTDALLMEAYVRGGDPAF